MRTVIELRRPLGSIPIEEIKLNKSSRDDTPAPRAIVCGRPCDTGFFLVQFRASG